MENDLSHLAARIAADIQDLRGCIIVSRDGMVLGCHPPEAEAQLRPAWLRFASLGDTEKGFIQFGSELWVYVRCGAYASFAVSNSVSRPGLLLDEMQQVLLDAADARADRDLGPVPGGDAPRSKPRTPLHPEARPAAPAPAPTVAELAASDTSFAELSAMAQKPPEAEAAPPVVIETPAEQPAAGGGSWDLYPEFTASQPAEPDAGSPAAAQPTAPPAAPQPPRDPSESGEVDRVALAQEFAQLLGDTGYDDDDQQS